MTEKDKEKILTKNASAGRSTKCFSQCYIDFDNPDHGFTLIDSNAVFTVQKILKNESMKEVKKDPHMSKYLQDLLSQWKQEDEQKTSAPGSATKSRKRGRPKAQTKSSASQELPEGNNSSESEKEKEDQKKDEHIDPEILIPEEEEGQMSDEDPESDFCRARLSPLCESVANTLALIDRTFQTGAIVPVDKKRSQPSKSDVLDDLDYEVQKSKSTKKVRIES
jgi:hypothetical protein